MSSEATLDELEELMHRAIAAAPRDPTYREHMFVLAVSPEFENQWRTALNEQRRKDRSFFFYEAKYAGIALATAPSIVAPVLLMLEQRIKNPPEAKP